MRPNSRQDDELRDIKITRNFTRYAEGSVLLEFGNTIVLCNASVEAGVPRFLRNKEQGWLTAEYSMLPRSTHDRSNREASRGKQSGRTIEIQRLIGRALRASVNLEALNGYTITLDCDVLQADGGTRTASITGGSVALYDAIHHLLNQNKISANPFKHFIGAVSVGIHQGRPILDLDYSEDSSAETDMNVVMNDVGGFIEVQGTAEGQAFSPEEFAQMMELAKQGIQEINRIQKAALGCTEIEIFN